MLTRLTLASQPGAGLGGLVGEPRGDVCISGLGQNLGVPDMCGSISISRCFDIPLLGWT